ncbi:carboxypeptidase-like regulatory domain-containing protein [Chitinispirillales bacterium ANBcel5]|uniref:carboxypeptidase-like regulatory domain-containing protein n=1 Tax=Cellulosispirillum alkaliphilum TaxID=3039283 RepID=UPI002A52B963|nr:carboxypeptidase-like regulatory domain-containing protein [Chitinispirillales bacterium ANBcel5]
MLKLNLLVALVLVLCGCGVDHSGGSSDQGNARIAGVIQDNFQKPAEDVIITLLPNDYNHITDSTSNLERVAVSNWSGEFYFDSLKAGVYTLVGKDAFDKSFIQRNIVVQKDGFYTFDFDLKLPATISLHPDTLDNPGLDAVYIPGTRIWGCVTPNVELNLNRLPAGIISLRGYNFDEGKEVALNGDKFNNIELIAARKLYLQHLSPTPAFIDSDGIGHTLYKGKTGVVHTISTVYPPRNFNHEYQYRVSWGDGTISEWFSSPLSSYTWTEPGVYMVQTQERRANTYLAWSQPIMIEISNGE